MAMIANGANIWMNKKDFSKSMMIISGAYRDKRYCEDQTLNAWYMFFKDYSSDVFYRAVVGWIREYSKMPAVSDLLSLCELENRKEESDSKELEEELSDEEWLEMMSRKFGE